MGQPNAYGEKSPNAYGEKSFTGMYGSTELSWLEESDRHLWVNQTLTVGRV